MLRYLRLENVGPAPEMELQLGERLNLITGDNGLGKSFLLDVAWWALTRKWPQELNASLTSGFAARPTNLKRPATITFEVEAKSKSVSYESRYIARDQAWEGRAGRPLNPGLVLYALADGGFAVWDPARNYWRKRGNIDIQDRVPAYVFSSRDVWDGLKVPIAGVDTRVCNGLVADWASWIREKSVDAERMASVLALLAPLEGGVEVGEIFGRLSINDVRDIPTLRTGYGQDVMILHASLGVRRITALAYMLSWAWREHLIAANALGEEPSSRVVLLFDELEAHLHPRWQRAIVPALLEVVQTLTRDASASVQLIAATHSPLVLASLEPEFDADRDAWFDLDLERGAVVLRKREFVRRGDVSNWLTSAAFDLKEPVSLPAEVAIQAALELTRRSPPVSAAEYDRVERQLEAVLGDTDRFWMRWKEFRRRAAADGVRS